MSERDEPKRRGRRLFELPVGEDVDRELRFHIEMRAKELEAEGWDAAAARAEAARLFGNVEQLGEECRGLERAQRRTRRRGRMVDAVRQDLRFGTRMLLRTPAFSALAVLTLALGMGANTAIFSVVNGVLLRPLPYPAPHELVLLWELTEEGTQNHVSTPNFRDWRAQSGSFAAIAAHPSARFWSRTTVLGGTEAAHVRVAPITRDFFAVMGVASVMGRTTGDEDHRLGATPAVVVSHGFWQRWLGSDPQLDRHLLRAGDRAYQVVGVMPPGFDYPNGSDAWVPVELDEDNSGRTSHNWIVIARLRDGISLAAAKAEMAGLGVRLKAAYGEDSDAASVDVVRLADELVGGLRRPLYLLLGAAGLVLLIACTNLASALLARGARREAEMAVRASLGAARGRIVSQLLVEAMLLSVAGAALGLVLGGLLINGLVALAPAGLPRLDEVRLDGVALLFTLLASVATAILFGLYPALRLSRAGTSGALRAAGRGNTSGRSPWWGMLVAVEVALALLLLVGSGLLMRSFWRVLHVDPGFDARGVLTADLSLPNAKYPDHARTAAFHRELLAEVEQLAGVQSAGIINHLPMAGFSINGAFEIEGRGEEDGGYADYRIASGEYFAAMNIPLLEGRTFAPTDAAGAPDVVIINRAAARRFWPDESPIGKRIRNLANDSHIYPDRWLTVIGVVGDVRHSSLTGVPRAETYVHYLQRPARAANAVLTVRTSTPPSSLAPALRAALARLDRDVAAELHTMDNRIASSVADRRFTMLVLGVFAGLALLLAGVGIYGVVSYAVARRAREIGIRLALGVTPRSVRWLMQRQVLIMVLAGASAGAAAAIALTGVLRSLLFDVSPTDPLVFAGVILLLIAVAWLASYLPARRTTRVDPMIVLRSE